MWSPETPGPDDLKKIKGTRPEKNKDQYSNLMYNFAQNVKMKYLVLFLVGLCSISCQNESKTQENSIETPVNHENSNTTIPPSTDPLDRATWGFLTNGIFHYASVIHVKDDIPKSDYAGKWIDLESDFSYTWGFYNEIEGKGTWKYHPRREILDIMPETSAYKRSEWRVKNADSFIVMAGTVRFYDNAIQMKWVREDSRPTK